MEDLFSMDFMKKLLKKATNNITSATWGGYFINKFINKDFFQNQWLSNLLFEKKAQSYFVETLQYTGRE